MSLDPTMLYQPLTLIIIILYETSFKRVYPIISYSHVSLYCFMGFDQVLLTTFLHFGLFPLPPSPTSSSFALWACQPQAYHALSMRTTCQPACSSMGIGLHFLVHVGTSHLTLIYHHWQYYFIVSFLGSFVWALLACFISIVKETLNILPPPSLHTT